MVARRSPQCLGWLLVCFLIGSTGTCLAAKFTLPTAIKNQKFPDRGLLHPIPLQAELLQLNQTLGVLAHATGQRANVLTQQAAKDAWNAVQVALKPIAAQQSTSISRRKLQQTNTAGTSFLTPELSDLLMARLRTAAQSALQLQGGQQNPLSANSFLSPELSEMVASRLRSAAQSAFQSQGQQLSQQLQSAFTANLRSQLPQFNASVQSITEEVNRFRADAKERLGSLTKTIKALRGVETMMDSMFDQAKKIRGVAAKEDTKDIISVAPAKSRRLQQVSSTTASASATGSDVTAVSGSDSAASLAVSQLLNATMANLTVGPAATADASSMLSSSSSSSASTAGSSSSSVSTSSAKRRLRNADGDGDDHIAVVRDLQIQVSDVLAALQSLQDGAVVQDGPLRRRLLAQARGLESRFHSRQGNDQRRRRLQQDDHVFLNPELVGSDGEQRSDSFAARHASEGARSGPQGDLTESDEGEFDTLQATASGYAGPTHIQNTVIIMMPPVNSSADTAMVGDMLDLIQELVQSSFIPLPPMSAPSAILQQMFQTLGELEGSYGMAPASEGNFFDYDTFAEAPAPEEEEGAQSSRRRRNMLTHQQHQGEPSFASKTAYVDAEDADYDYDMDAAYAEDDAWIWDSEEQDMAPLGLGRSRLEEALFGFSSGDDGIMELVISMTAPVEDGGIPPALMHLLAYPQGASAAELLDLLSSPNYGGYHIESSSMAASQAEMPRFAVFGPSAASSIEHMGMAHSAMATTVTKKERNGRISELIVVPLSGAAKAPIPHGQVDTPTGMDARWWGVVLSLGALGLLLVGASLATLKLSPTAKRDLAGEFDSVHGGQRGGARNAAAAGQQERVPLQEPVSPWESKVQQKDLIKSKVEKTPRKTSNLPA